MVCEAAVQTVEYPGVGDLEVHLGGLDARQLDRDAVRAPRHRRRLQRPGGLGGLRLRLRGLLELRVEARPLRLRPEAHVALRESCKTPYQGKHSQNTLQLYTLPKTPYTLPKHPKHSQNKTP